MVIGIVIGVVIGALLVFAWHATSVSSLRARADAAERTASSEAQILEAVRAAQAEALQGTGATLVDLADQKMQTSTAKVEGTVKPVAEQLHRLQERLNAIEAERSKDAGNVKGLVEQLTSATRGLASETQALNQAMKDNRIRGTWGEMQLRRVVELAGMQEHCDFDEQVHVVGEDRTGRPDLVVRLPQAKTIVVDSKVPLNSYIEAVNIGTSEPEAAQAKLVAHAAAMADHVGALAKRDYAKVVDGSVDFVVMFVPGEAFLSAAYEARPALFDEAIAKGVFIATPTTLIALLKAISFGWRQERLAENAKAIAATGAQLLERLAKFTDTFAKVGASIERAQSQYNEAVGSFERRLLPTAREMRAHGVMVAEIEPPDRVDLPARPFTAAELAPGDGDEPDQR
jgi:DNA recombination protein RmuC